MKKLLFLLLILIPAFSIELYTQWHLTEGNFGEEVLSLRSNNSTLFAGSDKGFFVSTNNGSNWLHTPLSYSAISILYISGTLITGTTNKVYKSTDNGNSWIAVHNGMNTEFTSVFSLFTINNYIFAGTSSGVYKTSNSGSLWDSSNNGLNNYEVFSISGTTEFLFAGTQQNGIYRSSDFGNNWISAGLTGLTVFDIHFQNSVIYAATNTGLYRSSDNGINWVFAASGIGTQRVFKLHHNGTYFLAGTNSGIFYSGDGVSWYDFSEGMGNRPVKAITSNTEYFFAGAFASGVWKRSSAEIFAGNNQSIIPYEIKLHQNYPNPFNPVTTISFELPFIEHTGSKNIPAKLEIINIEGKVVYKTEFSTGNPGNYTIKWDSGSHTSGIYFYRLSYGSLNITKKMILLK